MLISARPTDRFNRYLATVSTTYNAIIANSNSIMLYSVLYGFSWIDSCPGLFRCIIFRMSHGMPSDIKIAKEFAPSELDTPTPPSFFRTISTEDIPSGRQPPAAKKVSPITASGIRNVVPKFDKETGEKEKKTRNKPKRMRLNSISRS